MAKCLNGATCSGCQSMLSFVPLGLILQVDPADQVHRGRP